MNEMMLRRCEEHKEEIRKLYCDEGKSKEYIRDLLQLSRSTLDCKIKEWGFSRPAYNSTPSSKKFINQNKERILCMLRNDIPLNRIAKELGVSEDKLWYHVRKTPELAAERDLQKQRVHDAFIAREKAQSHYEYDFDEYRDESWKPILGYDGYEISNYGRVRSYVKKYSDYYLVKAIPNILTGRPYVYLRDNKGKRHGLQVHRLVAFAFCEGYSPERNTVNHKDGNVANNHFSNLEWVSQSENNQHAYDVLGRKVNIGKKFPYTILYKGKYSFKTIAAFARFIGKGETTARRWIDEADKHDIQLIA